jgi:hypothetical protein
MDPSPRSQPAKNGAGGEHMRLYFEALLYDGS